MSSSPPEAQTLRDAAAADAAVLAEFVAADEFAARGDSETGVTDVREWLELASAHGSAWVVEGPERDLRGCAFSFIEGVVADVWVTADGAAFAELVEVAERTARERGATTVRQGVFAEHAARRAFLEARGYRVVRHFLRMEVVLETPPPPPEWPPGLEIEPLTRANARAFYDAGLDAFADEWGFHALPFEEFLRLRIEGPDADPSLSFLVRDAEEVAAILRADGHRFGGGWIGMIGVRTPWRRRGLAQAMLRQAFGEFYRRGERRVLLGVDAENPTGATRLYEKVGMRVKHEDVVYEKALP